MGRQRKEHPDRGFTLIELLVVVVVLGILASVVVFAVRGMRAEAEGASCSEDRGVLETAVETWLGENPDEPVTEADLVADGRLAGPSTLHDVELDGAVIPVGRCAAAPITATTVDPGPVGTAAPDTSVPSPSTSTGATLDPRWLLVSGAATSPTPDSLSIPASASVLTTGSLGPDQTVRASVVPAGFPVIQVRLAASPGGDGYSVRFSPGRRVRVRVTSGGISCSSSVAWGSWPSGLSTSDFSVSASLVGDTLRVQLGSATVIDVADLAARVASRCGMSVPSAQRAGLSVSAAAELTAVSAS